MGKLSQRENFPHFYSIKEESNISSWAAVKLSDGQDEWIQTSSSEGQKEQRYRTGQEIPQNSQSES